MHLPSPFGLIPIQRFAVESHTPFDRLRRRRPFKPVEGSATRSELYGSFNTWPGLILSGSLSWSLLALNIFMYAFASPSCDFAIALSVSPGLTVYVLAAAARRPAPDDLDVGHDIGAPVGNRLDRVPDFVRFRVGLY